MMSKLATALVASAALLGLSVSLSGCSKPDLAATGSATPVVSVTAEPSVSSATPDQSATPSASSAPVESAAVSQPAAPATSKAAATVKATAATTKAATTKAATTKAAVTQPAATATKQVTAAGALTLSCTWDGTRVVALAKWSGYPGVIITVSAPGASYTTAAPSMSNRVYGTTGQHGSCSASGGGQSKSGSA